MSQINKKCRCAVCKQMCLFFDGHPRCSVVEHVSQCQIAYWSFICVDCFKTELQKIVDDFGSRGVTAEITCPR
jgi:hypothetical protein